MIVALPSEPSAFPFSAITPFNYAPTIQNILPQSHFFIFLSFTA